MYTIFPVLRAHRRKRKTTWLDVNAVIVIGPFVYQSSSGMILTIYSEEATDKLLCSRISAPLNFLLQASIITFAGLEYLCLGLRICRNSS